MIESGDLEVVIDATGDPAAGVRHALAASDNGLHMIMVNVEADVLAGPLLAARARDAGTVYSLAYGDQPALICELVDELLKDAYPFVIVIDDGSSPDRRSIFDELAKHSRVRVLTHAINLGKGDALKTGFNELKPSSVVCGRLHSSFSTVTSSS